MSNWPKKRRALLIVGIAFALCIGVAMTAFFGKAMVKERAVADMNLASGVRERTGAVSSLPHYYCSARTYGPFVVRADYGWHSGPLSGKGGSAIYIWVFGWTKRVIELQEWAS